jgi:predicted dehydrogenase
MADHIRWGILSTANIARTAFLPALRAAGGGTASVVASRDLPRARTWAAENDVERAVEGYEAVLRDDSIDAVYIPLPNGMHGEWTEAALRAGKTVLCEKPMCVSAQETAAVLDVARETKSLLWEAFVFPFHRQMDRVRQLQQNGDLGEIHEVQSSFHFTIRDRANIRLSADLAGGAVYDVGCYCIRLARFVFEAEAIDGTALATWAPEGVDEEMEGVLRFPGNRNLIFSCGMRRPQEVFGRVVGADGELRMNSPFHPRDGAVLEIRRGAHVESESVAMSEPTFSPAIEHIHAVLRGEEKPQHLAVDEAMGNAEAIDILLKSARAQA